MPDFAERKLTVTFPKNLITLISIIQFAYILLKLDRDDMHLEKAMTKIRKLLVLSYHEITSNKMRSNFPL